MSRKEYESEQMNTVQHTRREKEINRVLRIEASEAKPLIISNVEPI